jgi:hypothetical protein
VDLEAWEFGLRRAVLAGGARLLEQMVKGVGCGRREKLICVCGARMRSVGRRAKTLCTALGPIAWRRSLFVCPGCGASQFPGDAILNVRGQSASPGLRRLTARAGSQAPFALAAEDLAVYAELRVNARFVERTAEEEGRRVERWMQSQADEALARARRPAAEAARRDLPVLYVSFDGTGIPMRRSELAGRPGKGPDGEAHTREVKLGCVFTQTACNDEGAPIRDPASTTYVGAIEDSQAFGWRIFAEALRRGLDKARRIAVLTDGARYCQTLVALHFPGAIHIIDFYHACEHLDALTERLAAADKLGKWRALLDAGRIESLVRRARRRLPARGGRRKDALAEIAYFADNAERMRYADFRRQGLFVGSGVVEAGCRTVIGQRLKQSGMFWSLAGANAIIAARCCLLSGRFEQFWEDQAAA